MTSDLPRVRITDSPVPLPAGLVLPPIVRGAGRGFREVRIPLWNDNEFKRLWQRHKLAFCQRGFTIRLHNGAWWLSQWLSGGPGGWTLTARGAEKVAELLAGAKPAALIPEIPVEFILPELPYDLEAKLFPYQRQPARQLYRALVNGREEWGYPGAWDCSEMGCHAKGQLILMADGARKTVESVAVGDAVMGWKGPQTVTALKRGRSPMATIKPVKGEPWTVNLDHMLTMQYSPTSPGCGMGKYSGRIIDITVGDFLRLPPTHRAQLKLFRMGVDYWPENSLPIDPYFLGVYLGDGCTRHNGTTVSISKPDPEIEAEVIRQCGIWGCDYRKHFRTPTNPSHHMTGTPRLAEALKQLGLFGLMSGEKFIPHDYLSGSKDQRAAMLAGLLDTDGHLDAGGSYEFISASWDLADGVCFLARSLGLAAYLKPCSKGCQNGFRGDYWRVSISGDCTGLPIRIPRKKARKRIQKKSVLRTGLAVELLPDDEFYGFSLSGDGRFLLGDFTVTHNTGKTYQSLAAAVATDKRVGVICPRSVIGDAKMGTGWLGAFRHFGQEAEFILNYEGLRTGRRDPVSTTGNPGRPYEWNLNPDEVMLIWDESHQLKNPSRNRAMAFAALRQGFTQLFLSGTMAEQPTNLGATGVAVGLHKGDRATYAEFLRTHGCSPAGSKWKFDRHRGASHLARIHHKVFPQRGARVKISDLGDLFPDTQILAEPIETEDTAEIIRAYAEAEALIDVLRRQGFGEQQILNAQRAAYMKARKMSEIAKVPALVERAKEELEAGRSVALFVNFTEARERIQKALKTSCAVFGGQDMFQRNDRIAEFQADRSRVIVVMSSAGGVGVSLHDTHGNYPRTALICPDNNAVTLGQVLGRVHRAGGKSKSRQLILYAKGTVEDGICANVRRKLSSIATVNDGDLNPERKF